MPTEVVVAPHLPLPLDADLDLIIESTVTGDTFFRLRDLRLGSVDWEGRQVSLNAFHHGGNYGVSAPTNPSPVG